jgi:predicted DNA-binding transcriptional regulator AlpA
VQRYRGGPPLAVVVPADRITTAEMEQMTGVPTCAAEYLSRVGRFPPAVRLRPGVWVFRRADIVQWLRERDRRRTSP